LKQGAVMSYKGTMVEIRVSWRDKEKK